MGVGGKSAYSELLADPWPLTGLVNSQSEHMGAQWAKPSPPTPLTSACPCCVRQVLLLSARNALLSRLMLAGCAGPDATRRFMRLAFGFKRDSVRPEEVGFGFRFRGLRGYIRLQEGRAAGGGGGGGGGWGPGGGLRGCGGECVGGKRGVFGFKWGSVWPGECVWGGSPLSLT